MEAMDRRALGIKRRDVDELMATTPKHYMRREVWLPSAVRRQALVARPITYFTLTTADLFDVKLLERAGVVERTLRGYPGVGFCERDDKTHADIVRKLRSCHLAHKGTFEDMVLQDAGIEERFEFDVINLDFTWVPFPEQEAPLEGTWGAIKRVLEIQWDKRKGFDLFLTFRGSRSGTNSDAITKMAELLQGNLASGRGVQEFKSRVGHLDPIRLLDENYETFLCMGLPKLLIGDALQLGYDVKGAEAYWYPRGEEEGKYYIVKFVLNLDVPDRSLGRFAVPPQVVTSYDAAVAQVFSTDVVDVGELVDKDPGLQSYLERDLEELKRLD